MTRKHPDWSDPNHIWHDYHKRDAEADWHEELKANIDFAFTALRWVFAGVALYIVVSVALAVRCLLA